MLLFNSCQEEINLDLNNQETERLIVEGRVTNENKHHSVRLTRSISYFQNEIVPPLLEASVYLVEDKTGNKYDMQIIDDTLGIYISDQFKGVVGCTYSLHIDFNGESWEALSYLDTVPDMDSINTLNRAITS